MFFLSILGQAVRRIGAAFSQHHSMMIDRPEAITLGQELRVNPTQTDFSDWLKPSVVQVCKDNLAYFPATFDRTVWPRTEDPETTSHRQSTALTRRRNIVELFPLDVDIQEDADASQWAIAAALFTFRSPIGKAMRNTKKMGPLPLVFGSVSDWVFMGYEAIDSGLAISALLNFDQRTVELARDVAKRTGTLLNHFCLWEKLEPANQFALAMSQLVPDHAPFDVMALFAKNRNQPQSLLSKS